MATGKASFFWVGVGVGNVNRIENENFTVSLGILDFYCTEIYVE